jgi:hypothetical protein
MDQINLTSFLHGTELPMPSDVDTLRSLLPGFESQLADELKDDPASAASLSKKFLDYAGISTGITVDPGVIADARRSMQELLKKMESRSLEKQESSETPQNPRQSKTPDHSLHASREDFQKNPANFTSDFRGSAPSVPAKNPVSASAPTPASGSPAQLATLLPFFIALKGEIEKDLESNISKLMTLNPSRREAVATYLDRLAGHGAAPSSISGNLDAAGGLRRWIEGPRTPAQNLALQIYFEEIALITLGQALLLKAWSDRGLRPWSRNDLKDLNWALNTAIKKFIPHDRDNWHIAKQNIYSWYKPGDIIQSEIWETTNAWRIQDEGPGFLPWLYGPARAYRTENMAPQGYDSRFYQAIWRNLPGFGFNPNQPPGPIRRNWIAFSPTLRDGALTRITPPSITWIGLETSSFHLMTAELSLLWWKPSAPPLWSLGTGLEAHASDQLSLSTGYSNPKPSLISRIAEMEACDLAFVLEERSGRIAGKNIEANRLREQLEHLPYFKKLRSTGTTLGDLQACVSMTKLRPGGLLWWAREEPLTETDGREMLHFMLERAKLVCEWDFSQLEHSLPAAKPAFPKHLYLFARESGVEARLTHRPVRITLQGQIRSHVEIPLILQDAFQAIQGTAETRAQWKVLAQTSPTPQREWSERWPDPTSQSTLLKLERIRESSVPLANVTTVRPAPEASTPGTDPRSRDDKTWTPQPDLNSLKGFWIFSESNAEGRRLRALPLATATQEQEPTHSASGSSFLILVADQSWLSPLSQYLESESVRLWLDHHAERKGGRWVLSEQVVKCIPVPGCLLAGLGFDFGQSGVSPLEDFSLNRKEEDRLLTEFLKNPREATSRLQSLSLGGRASIFVQASKEIGKLKTDHGSLLALVTSSGKIRWTELLKMLPQSECVALTLHAKVRIQGNLPLHLAIGRIERVKAPGPGILLTTEAGFHLCVSSDSQMLVDMLWDQLEGLNSPTWSELVAYLRLPRRLEVAEATASEVLKIHGDQSRRIKELSDLISACSLF